jgi:hypothetical protein
VGEDALVHSPKYIRVALHIDWLGNVAFARVRC